MLLLPRENQAVPLFKKKKRKKKDAIPNLQNFSFVRTEITTHKIYYKKSMSKLSQILINICILIARYFMITV